MRVSSYNLKPTFSPTVSESNSAPSWNTIPVWSRTFSSSSSLIRSICTPCTQMRPESGASNPRISFSTVDLPEPLAPRKILVNPGKILKLMPSSTTLSSKARRTSSNTTTGSSPGRPLAGPRSSSG